MRISDWSSAVCSSDLLAQGRPAVACSRCPAARSRHSWPRASRRSLVLAPQHEVNSLNLLPHPEEARQRRLEGCATGSNDSPAAGTEVIAAGRSEAHTSELQSLMRISHAVFCLKKQRHT